MVKSATFFVPITFNNSVLTFFVSQFCFLKLPLSQNHPIQKQFWKLFTIVGLIIKLTSKGNLPKNSTKPRRNIGITNNQNLMLRSLQTGAITLKNNTFISALFRAFFAPFATFGATKVVGKHDFTPLN